MRRGVPVAVRSQPRRPSRLLPAAERLRGACSNLATIHSDHAWLPITTVASTAIIPGNTPPAQISTQGDYSSPRGCRGTFGSVGTAEATRIDADFNGVDCTVTFTGHVTLTKP